jgi:hypothetical protein
MTALKGKCQKWFLGRAPFVEPAEITPATFQHLIRVNHDTAGDTYRCFLPDLTGFVFVCCAVSNR